MSNYEHNNNEWIATTTISMCKRTRYKGKRGKKRSGKKISRPEYNLQRSIRNKRPHLVPTVLTVCRFFIDTFHYFFIGVRRCSANVGCLSVFILLFLFISMLISNGKTISVQLAFRYVVVVFVHPFISENLLISFNMRMLLSSLVA